MSLVERFILSSAVFFGTIPFIGVLLGWIGFIHWWTVLSISLVFAFVFFMRYKLDDKSTRYALYALLVFVIFSSIMFYGTFKYGWLEDDDPYGYAVVTQYISEKGTFMKPADLYLENYAEPDSVGYSVFMAAWYDLFGNMNFVLKFFNTLIVCLALLWFFVFSKKLFNDERTAFYITLVLACLPSFLTHFIFATPLALALFFPAFALLSDLKPENYSFCVFIIASILVTHHLTGLVFGLFFMVFWFFEKRTVPVFFAGLVGFILSLAYWIPELVKYGFDGMMRQLGITSVSNIVGTADKLYGIKDLLVVSTNNLINTSIGWGCAIILLLILSWLSFKTYKEQKFLLVWFVMGIVGILSVYLPWKLMPFRWWSFVAIPVALIAGYELNIWSLKTKLYQQVIFLFLFALLICFSAYPKTVINTSTWGPSGSLQQPGVLDAHLWMKDNLPVNTPVFSFHTASKLQGFNMWSCDWCRDEIVFKQGFPVRVDELHDFLVTKHYEYFIVPTSWYVAKYGEDNTAQQMSEINKGVLSFWFPVFDNGLVKIWKVI